MISVLFSPITLSFSVYTPVSFHKDKAAGGLSRFRIPEYPAEALKIGRIRSFQFLPSDDQDAGRVGSVRQNIIEGVQIAAVPEGKIQRFLQARVEAFTIRYIRQVYDQHLHFFIHHLPPS
jgi:hypothetical protein